MTKDIDTTGAFGTSATGTQVETAVLDLDLSEGLDLDLSEGPGYVDGAIKDAGTETFDPTTDRVVFQAAKGLDLIL